MAEATKSRRSFPPGIGWLPVAVAALVLVVASSVALVPQFRNQVTGQTAPGTDGTQADPSADAAGQAGSAGGSSTTQGGVAGGRGVAAGAVNCAAGKNGGNTDVGVSATEIHVATTQVTTGVGAGFLGEAVDGIQAAITQANNGGGVCGRRIVMDPRTDVVNSGWSRDTGARYIDGFINSGKYFALVGEPDSEGLAGAIDSGAIDRAKIPVVGTDGMLRDQYHDPWVYPVAASTVTNMHIAVQYAYQHGARSFGIVYDTDYKFGREGAEAFDQEVHRLTGGDVPGHGQNGCSQQYCGIPSQQQGGYSTYIQTFDAACKPCDMVMMLLEPQPMENWMQGESGSNGWYKTLMGGEPLFDDSVGANCPGCAGMTVWTGYHPSIPPFDSEPPVYTYAQALKSQFPNDDPHNVFTEGAYLGTQLFIDACKQVAAQGLPLTRANLKKVLDSGTFSLGLAVPLRYNGSLHLANQGMAAFSDNRSGSFNGWTYQSTGFISDPAPGQEQ